MKIIICTKSLSVKDNRTIFFFNWTTSSLYEFKLMYHQKIRYNPHFIVFLWVWCIFIANWQKCRCKWLVHSVHSQPPGRTDVYSQQMSSFWNELRLSQSRWKHTHIHMHGAFFRCPHARWWAVTIFQPSSLCLCPSGHWGRKGTCVTLSVTSSVILRLWIHL